MDEVTYGFNEKDIALLADSVSRILGRQLYSQCSPMCGQWYSSQPWQESNTILQAIKKALEQHDIKTAEELNRAVMAQPEVELRLNDPDLYYCPDSVEEEVHCILRIRESPEALIEIDKKFRASGLKYIKLKNDLTLKVSG